MELAKLLELLDAAGSLPRFIARGEYEGSITWQVTFSNGDIVLTVHFVNWETDVTTKQSFVLSPVGDGKDGRHN